jgi:hypothetical protein
MRIRLRSVALFLLLLGASSTSAAAQRRSSRSTHSSTRTSSSSHRATTHKAAPTVRVQGYTTKSGRLVAPYSRSAPRATPARTAAPKKPTTTTRPPRRTTLTPGASARAATPPRPGAAITRAPVARRASDGRIARSATAKSSFMRNTGYPSGRPGYVVDHIIPLSCGGPDTPSNMQWQTVAAAKAKDKTERKGCGTR